MMLTLGAQFKFVSLVFGSSDAAVSGATILSVSVVFTGLMFLTIYYHMQRLRQADRVETAADGVSRAIKRGRRTASRIRTLSAKAP